MAFHDLSMLDVCSSSFVKTKMKKPKIKCQWQIQLFILLQSHGCWLQYRRYFFSSPDSGVVIMTKWRKERVHQWFTMFYMLTLAQPRKKPCQISTRDSWFHSRRWSWTIRIFYKSKQMSLLSSKPDGKLMSVSSCHVRYIYCQSPYVFCLHIFCDKYGKSFWNLTDFHFSAVV